MLEYGTLTTDRTTLQKHWVVGEYIQRKNSPVFLVSRFWSGVLWCMSTVLQSCPSPSIRPKR